MFGMSHQLASKPSKSKHKQIFSLGSLPQPGEFAAVRGPLIGSYLRRLLQSPVGENGHASEGWVFPSALELSGFFHCSECDVLAAFNELKHSGYDYEIKGLDAPVVMHSPAYSQQREQPWKQPGLGQMLSVAASKA